MCLGREARCEKLQRASVMRQPNVFWSANKLLNPVWLAKLDRSLHHRSCRTRDAASIHSTCPSLWVALPQSPTNYFAVTLHSKPSSGIFVLTFRFTSGMMKAMLVCLGTLFFTAFSLAQMTSEPSTCKGTGAGLSLATAGERILHF
jgi:hypothetical protein